MNEITVVSLGPGPREYITLGALEALKSAENLLLRTSQCDAVAYLAQIGLSFDTLDAFHNAAEDFDAFNIAAAREVQKRAQNAPVCYAVLDASTDETVHALRALAPVAVVAGMPLSAPFLAAAPQAQPLTIADASSLRVHDAQLPLLVTELDSRILAGECKLKLLGWYDGAQEVLFFPPAKAAKRSYVRILLEEMDRQKAYDHTCAVLIPRQALMQRSRFDMQDLVEVMAILRGENGCPWDLEQTHQSLRKYLIEEAYETAAAIDEEDWEHVADELGDVLLQVVFQASIGAQYGTFELSDITTAICKKMISRHRHIFGADECKTAEDVLTNWEKIKREERGFTTQGDVLLGVSKGLPPLMRAGKVQSKAKQVGFDWDDPRDALRKVHEEAEEVLAELDAHQDPAEEIGDLFFACVNVARLSGVESETALMQATEKFISRFILMENAIIQAGKSIGDLTLSEMDVYWESSKQR